MCKWVSNPFTEVSGQKVKMKLRKIKPVRRENSILNEKCHIKIE